MITIKNDGKKGTDAKVKGMQPEILLAVIIANDLMERTFNRGLTLTSVTDSHKDKPSSLHNVGMAFDMRTWEMSGNEKAKFSSELRNLLGEEYDVVEEGNHIHIEFDPPVEVEEELSPSLLTNEETQALLKETYVDKDEDDGLEVEESGVRLIGIEKKLDKILDWIKFHGEDMKCKSGGCKFDELEHTCRLEDQHICTAELE